MQDLSKHNKHIGLVRRRSAPVQFFGPQYLLREFAAEAGVSVQQLVGYMQHDPASPKPTVGHRSPSGSMLRGTRYSVIELRAWWKGRN